MLGPTYVARKLTKGLLKDVGMSPQDAAIVLLTHDYWGHILDADDLNDDSLDPLDADDEDPSDDSSS